MESWLSLAVSGKDNSVKAFDKALFFIAVPKKVVSRATARNRVKRLIREAVRGDVFFEANKIYAFKVRSVPKNLDLRAVQKTIDRLKNG